MSVTGPENTTDRRSQSAETKTAKPDLTGREQMTRNVIASWGGHFVFVIAGFIMPRMIDNRLGHELLGVWDFAWSLIAYFGLVQAGIGSSVNRYVAKYRAVGDMDGVNRAVSSVWCFHMAAGAIVLVLTVVLSLFLPFLFGTRLGENVVTAQWIVFLMGASAGLRVSVAAFSGVVSGCHRWDLHNAITSGFHAVVVGGMITALCLGGGLVCLAIISSVGLLLADFSRVPVAYRLCHGLHVRPGLATWRQGLSMLAFGGKTLIPSVGRLLLNQTISIMIVAYLGLAPLAFFARSQSLIRHLETLVAKLAHVLTPTASALSGAKKKQELRSLLIRSTRYAFFITLPITLVLVIFGDAILTFWMGSWYGNGTVLTILAVGFLPTIGNLPVLSILTGMNAHGRPGLAYLLAAVLAVVLAALALGPMQLGLTGAAVAIVVPLALANGVYLPIYACRRMGIRIGKFYSGVLFKPVLCAMPFAICLLSARVYFSAYPLTAAVWGCSLGFAVLVTLYWIYVLPERLRGAARRILGLKRVAA